MKQTLSGRYRDSRLCKVPTQRRGLAAIFGTSALLQIPERPLAALIHRYCDACANARQDIWNVVAPWM